MNEQLQHLSERVISGHSAAEIIDNATEWFSPEFARMLSHVKEWSLDDLRRQLADGVFESEVRSVLYIYFGIHEHNRLEECVALRDELRGSTNDQHANDLVQIYVLGSATQAGVPDQYLLPDVLLGRSVGGADKWGTLLAIMAHSNMGRAYQQRGNFRFAHEMFSKAQQLSTDLPWTTLACDLRMAGLYWTSGQLKEALKIYLDEDFLENATNYSPVRRVSIHLSTAKCAIDTKDAALAQQELCKAVELLPQTGRKDLDAYATLYAGELSVLKERYGEGRELLMGAAASFDALDPPHFVGMLDAKIALAHFAFYDNDRALAFLIMRKLLDEAEELNCFHARSRLLVLETCLFVSDNPPLKQAYDDLITRVHLINNPALLFQALGNLYTYSLGFLSDRDSAYMLQRIRNLEGVIEKSCFEDLYRAYITERYEYAIENRLARLADAEGDGHDFDAPETDIDNNPEVEFE